MASPELAGTMMQMASGYWVSQAIRAACELDLADHLKVGPRHFEDLAEASNANPNATFRLLRALASVGIFAETGEKGVFDLTPMADFLRSDSPMSMRDMIIHWNREELFRPWGNIMHTMRTGTDATQSTFGMNIFEYFASNPEASTAFNAGMTSVTKMESKVPVTELYDFSPISTLMDVGGGQGLLLSTILKANPGMKGILFDLPPVIEQAKATMEQPVQERCQLVGGSFFEGGLPSGADAIVMKSILHDWSPEKQKEILKQCHAALPEKGKLLIAERVLPEGNVPHPGKWMDMHMMVVCPGGCEYTAAEYEKLLKSEGFEVQRVVALTGSDMSIVEAIKV